MTWCSCAGAETINNQSLLSQQRALQMDICVSWNNLQWKVPPYKHFKKKNLYLSKNYTTLGKIQIIFKTSGFWVKNLLNLTQQQNVQAMTLLKIPCIFANLFFFHHELSFFNEPASYTKQYGMNILQMVMNEGSYCKAEFYDHEINYPKTELHTQSWAWKTRVLHKTTLLYYIMYSYLQLFPSNVLYASILPCAACHM